MGWVFLNDLARDADAVREITRLLHEFKIILTTGVTFTLMTHTIDAIST